MTNKEVISITEKMQIQFRIKLKFYLFHALFYLHFTQLLPYIHEQKNNGNGTKFAYIFNKSLYLYRTKHLIELPFLPDNNTTFLSPERWITYNSED